MKINYHGKKFAGIMNSRTGQVSSDTIFQYEQQGMVLNATYSGGSILQGHMLGRINDDNSLYFIYHHLDEHQNLRSGCCYSRPEILPDGRIRLHEDWEWTHGGSGEGKSMVEEIRD